MSTEGRDWEQQFASGYSSLDITISVQSAMSATVPHIPWQKLPASPTNSTCKVWLLQAGSLDLPYDLVLLPGPNQHQPSPPPPEQRKWFSVSDFVFLVQHLSTGNYYLFDLGMCKDLIQHSTPAVRKNTLPSFRNYPASVADLLRKFGTKDQQPGNVKAVIFSHLDFDHIGDFGQDGFERAELWLGPTACSAARPGYPLDEKGAVFADDLPICRTVEWDLPSALLNNARRKALEVAKAKSYYAGIDLRVPSGGWSRIGAFSAVGDIFSDGSLYVVDAPGHAVGHQMLLVRVGNDGDDFILLSGDCFHHPTLLEDPLLTSRPPFGETSMHKDPETSIETLFRTRRCAEDAHVWVVGAHDFSVAAAVSGGRQQVEGLVPLDEWRTKGWKSKVEHS